VFPESLTVEVILIFLLKFLIESDIKGLIEQIVAGGNSFFNFGVFGWYKSFGLLFEGFARRDIDDKIFRQGISEQDQE
jgi:hypothetical protein